VARQEILDRIQKYVDPFRKPVIGRPPIKNYPAAGDGFCPFLWS